MTTVTLPLTDKTIPLIAIQMAAKTEGLDEMGCLNIIESEDPTPKQVAKLINKLIFLGFSKITFDPTEHGPFYSMDYGTAS
jgi:hypothetical protein